MARSKRSTLRTRFRNKVRRSCRSFRSPAGVRRRQEHKSDLEPAYNYIAQHVDPGTAPAQLDLPNVIKAFQVPMERQLHVMATSTNLLQDYVKVLGERTYSNDLHLQEAIEQLRTIVSDSARNQGNAIKAILELAIPSLEAQIVHAEQFAYQLALATVKVMKGWTFENIFVPLATQMAVDRQVQQAQYQHVTQTIIPQLHADLLGKLAPVAALATAAATAARNAAKVDRRLWRADVRNDGA